MSADPIVFTAAELAERWRTTTAQVNADCREGRIFAFKAGREWRIPAWAVLATEGQPGAVA